MNWNPNLTIKTGISGDDQEASFMNATLTVLGEGDSDLAVSVAVHLPDHMKDMTEGQVITALTEDLKHLTDIGYIIEVQIGPNVEPFIEDDDDPDYDDQGNLRAGCDHANQ